MIVLFVIVFLLKQKSLSVKTVGDFLSIRSCFGEKINECLAIKFMGVL